MKHIYPDCEFTYPNLPLRSILIHDCKARKVLNFSSHLKRLMVTIVLLTIVITSFAATKTWGLAGAGSWAAPANWVGGIAPVAGDDVVINLTAAGTISNVPTISLNSLSIGGTANVTLNGTGATTITINNIDGVPNG